MGAPANPLAGLSALKLALMAKEVRAQAQAVLRADPIAIIGMGCRVPGGGDTVERFWQLLCAGTDAVRHVPPDRWDADAWFDADPSASGRMTTREGGFLDRVDGFDAEYFAILPREAERMDPQQRLCLEVAIEALDDAGLTREGLRGSRTGVYVASYHNDYAQLQYGDLEGIDARTLTGTLHSVISGRLSYLLDLRGPSISIDTACSSSLVAIHLACQSLRTGESDMAVAGGVSVMIAPELAVSLSKVGFMAPDGRCKTFDASADGFGRGEGCGIVVLKRLSDAVSDGDRILAVVRGSAVNQDGHSTLLAAPSGPAQVALIREALANAQLEAGRIGLMETHGTGTALGDPIEVEAIATTLGRAEGAGPCWLGAVKANVGHLEAAAGVTGLIKAVLALRHEAVPAQVHFKRLSPHISLEGTRLAVPTRLEPWPAAGTPRCAAVSSFGVSGTNAHVIVEEAPRLPAADPGDMPDAARILPLSAHGDAALKALAQSWVEFLEGTPAAMGDICYTASERRSHYDCRVGVTGSTKQEWRARLMDFLRDEAVPGVAAGRRPATAAPRLAFVFSGQGPQWFAMGRELLAGEPVFRDSMAECDALLRPLSGWSLLEELAQPEERSRLAETRVAQPALFALQVALAALWKSWGVEPDGVVGHSVGEIAALHVAGALALPEAIRVVWHRGRIMQEATGLGRMASVGLTPEEAAELVEPFGDRLAVAAVNAPRSVVVSGETAAVEAAVAKLAARGVNHRMLPVDYAFHSAQMAPFQRRLSAELASVASSPARIPLYSTVTGGLAEGLRFDAAYFGRNVREPVRLASALGAMADDGYDAFLEIGPHPVLGGSIAECMAAREHPAAILASLRRNRPERESMLQACAGLYAAGFLPAWEAFQRAPGQVVSLPAYPWQRKRHWIRQRPGASAGPAGPVHPLLGRRTQSSAGVEVFEGDAVTAHAWLREHRIFGRAAMPAAAVMECLVAAAGAASGSPPPSITAFAMERPLFLDESESPSTRWKTVVTTTGPGRAELALSEAVDTSATDPEWEVVATATAERRPEPVDTIDATALAQPVAAEAVYARFAALGVEFGPAFRRLADIRRGAGVAQAWLELPDDLRTGAARHLLHPVLVDGALQLCSIAAAGASGNEIPDAVMLPVGADLVHLEKAANASRVLARARVRDSSGTSLRADVTLEAPDGTRIGAIEGLRFARADRASFVAAARRGSLYSVAWHPSTAEAAQDARAGGLWLVLSDRAGVGDVLARELAAAGARCVQAVAGERFERASTDRWVVDPADAAGFRRLLDEIGGREELRGVVHLWSVDVAPLAQDDGAAAEPDDVACVGATLHLVQALAGANDVPLYLVTRGAQVARGDEPAASLAPRAAGAWGLAGVIGSEHPELRVRTVDLDPAASPARCAAALRAELGKGEGADRAVALRGEQGWVPRIERYRARRAPGGVREAVHVEMVRPGTLDGVELRPISRRPLQADEVRLQVLAAGLNFRDVLLALGMYSGAAVPLGAECAGVVTELGSAVRDFAVGQRVFGYAPDSLGTECVVPAAFLAAVPAGMGAEDAAALPVAYLTAYYGLHRLARLMPRERVLIHAGAGGVGLAAVQLALRRGAEVYATAGSEEKRALLRSLGVAHAMDSRSLAFADEILALTAGAGVHVVLNSLAGDFIAASLRALGQGGRFLELGKRGILTPEEAKRQRPDVQYRAYDLGGEANADRGLLRPMYEDILAALADRSLRPLPVKTFALDEVSEAMRFMAQARHVGKIVLRVHAGAAPWRGVSAEATYWITGGLGALGIETARWLARRGARHLALTGRRPPAGAASEALRELESQGVAVRVFQGDAADPVRMKAILDEIGATMPALRGVIHAAGALHDGVLQRQRWEDSREVLRGKAHGAWLLHRLTRELPLDFFVLYSAAGVLLGAAGQGAYPAANAQLDALAQARRRMGLPALSVAWGRWAGGGMGAQAAAQGRDAWAARGLGAIEADDGFAALEQLLREDAVHAAVLPIDWTRFLAQLPAGADREFFAAVAPGARSPAVADAASPAATIPARLRALPLAQRRDAFVAHLAERALMVLGLDPSTRVDPATPLKEIGLDSLMAVELRNALNRTMGQSLPATLLFDYPTPDALAAHLASTLGIELEAPRAPTAAGKTAGKTAAKAQVAALTDAEAEAMLLAELGSGAPREGR